jgi:hypothetical protein
MKNVVAGVVSAAFLIVNIAPAFASAPIAEVSGLNGKVLINHGKGFEPATGSVLLNVGDKIMVGANSFAKINYLNAKCLVSANGSSVVTVTAKAPCSLGTVVGSVDNVFAVPAAAEAGPGADAGIAGLSTEATIGLGIGAVAVVGGGLWIAGVFKNCNGVSVC